MLSSQGTDRLYGLTEGLSSKIMRQNRSALLPSLIMMNQSHPDTVHGRLEELLVFEILKDGGTSYKNFSVRSLYKYVLRAIQDEPNKGGRSARKLMDKLALGRALVESNPSPTSKEKKKSKSFLQAEPILSTDVDPDDTKEEIEEEGGNNCPVTWRERLGGYLHPRDMRKLVTPFSASNEPELIVRRHAMLLNFDPLRAIILRDRLIVLVPDGADSILVQLERHIRGETHAYLEDRGQSSYERSNSSNALQKMASALPTDNNSDPNAGLNVDPTVALEDDELFADAMIENEWAELEGKEWINLPFELQSVDAVLSNVSSILADDVLDLQLGASAVITELVQPNADVGDIAQETLRTMKNSVSEMTSRVNGFNRAIDTLLGDYEDMALMNLSRLLTHPEKFVQPVPQGVLEEESDEPELILEAHLQRGHTLVNALSLVQNQISSTEDFAVRKSDTIRNRLLYINMLISIMSLAVAVGSFVGSVFGMNVINFYEDNENAFSIIVWSTVGGLTVSVTLVLITLRRFGALPNVFKTG